jgi:hypothetical protein
MTADVPALLKYYKSSHLCANSLTYSNIEF